MVDSGQGFAQLWRTNLKLKEGETINIGTNHDNVYEQNQKHIPGLCFWQNKSYFNKLN